jgi:ATP-dependent protease Clp ATPase subunit
MLQCSFCKKTEDEVAKLVAGPEVYICNECVAVARRLMRDRWLFFRKLRDWFRSLGNVRFGNLPAR